MPEDQSQKKNYTLNDIARELGVNKATVSKAISGKGSLSEETRSRILAFIDQCGYHPNAVAQSLARNRSYNIGLLMPEYVGAFDGVFFQDCLRGVSQATAERGYDLLLIMDSEDPVPHIARLMDHRKIDGVIVMRSLLHSPTVAFLKKRQVPFVLIGPSTDPEVLSVDNGNREACQALTALLIHRGVTKMALLGGDENNCVTHIRLRGFYDACDQAGLPRQDQHVCTNVTRGVQMSQALEQVLTRDTQCLICMDDHICNMALAHLRTSGIRIPQDMQVVSFYDNALLENHSPGITAIRFDAVRLGTLACRKLIDRLEGLPEREDPLPGYRLILRDSTL